MPPRPVPPPLGEPGRARWSLFQDDRRHAGPRAPPNAAASDTRGTISLARSLDVTQVVTTPPASSPADRTVCGPSAGKSTVGVGASGVSRAALAERWCAEYLTDRLCRSGIRIDRYSRVCPTCRSPGRTLLRSRDDGSGRPLTSDGRPTIRARHAERTGCACRADRACSGHERRSRCRGSLHLVTACADGSSRPAQRHLDLDGSCLPTDNAVHTRRVQLNRE